MQPTRKHSSRPPCAHYLIPLVCAVLGIAGLVYLAGLMDLHSIGHGFKPSSISIEYFIPTILITIGLVCLLTNFDFVCERKCLVASIYFGVLMLLWVLHYFAGDVSAADNSIRFVYKLNIGVMLSVWGMPIIGFMCWIVAYAIYHAAVKWIKYPKDEIAREMLFSLITFLVMMPIGFWLVVGSKQIYAGRIPPLDWLITGAFGEAALVLLIALYMGQYLIRRKLGWIKE